MHKRLFCVATSPSDHITQKKSATIDNRPTEKGLETRNFFAISHSGARYGHVI